MFVHIHRSLKIIAALTVSQFLFACGGGGDDAVATIVTDTKLKETALEIRLASTLIEVNSMGTNYYRARIDAGALKSSWAPVPVATVGGCFERGLVNIDSIPSVGDSYFYNGTKCAFPYKTTADTTIQTAAGKQDLIEISDPTLPTNSAWTYEDKLTTTSELTFKLNLAGKINFSGDRTDKGLVVTKYLGFADGSLQELINMTGTSRETSDFGLSEVSISGKLSCTYPPGIIVNGDCSASTGTVSGTIYGVSVNATMRQLPGAPETHEISYGDKKITVIVNKTDVSNQYANEITVKTSNGETFELTGEETWRLRFY